MRKRPINTGITRFLKDERFIEWKLLPSAELDKYWKDILQRNPKKREDFEQAERYFRDIIQFSLPVLPQEKKLEAMKCLKQSLRARNRRRVILRNVSVAVASVALFIASLFYFQHATDKPGGEPAFTTITSWKRTGFRKHPVYFREQNRHVPGECRYQNARR